MTRPTLRTAVLAIGALAVGWVLRHGLGEETRPAPPPRPFHVAVACECRGACVEEPCRVVLRRDGSVVLVPERGRDAGAVADVAQKAPEKGPGVPQDGR